ncbi:MAG: flavodoxin domain-containing protein [Candidatus Thorarchaeota archaeon]|jgi:flavorubredoxin
MKKAIIVYESKYGNTKRLAELIIKGIKQTRSVECTLKSIGEIHTTDLCDYDVILFGCPNHNQAPSRGITTFIERAGIVGLNEQVGAAFDTYTGGNKGVALKQLEKKIRDALPGVQLIAEGLSVKVSTRTGPLSEDELSRAHEFGVQIAKKIQQ